MFGLVERGHLQARDEPAIGPVGQRPQLMIYHLRMRLIRLFLLSVPHPRMADSSEHRSRLDILKAPEASSCLLVVLLPVLALFGRGNQAAAFDRLGEARPFARWEPSSLLRADVDCDGVEDVAALGHQSGDLVVAVAPGSGAEPETFQFAISGSRQDAVCNVPAQLELAPLAGDPPQDVQGFRRSETCKGLRLSGKFCTHDVFLYWNHQTHHLDWWRR